MECGGTPEISRGQLNIEESRKASRKLCMTHQNNPIDVPRYFLYWPSRSCLTSPGVWLQLSDVVSFRGFQCENINVKTASQISRLTVTSHRDLTWCWRMRKAMGSSRNCRSARLNARAPRPSSPRPNVDAPMVHRIRFDHEDRYRMIMNDIDSIMNDIDSIDRLRIS